MKPLLSVIIATKNREKYCIAAIQSILKFNDPRIQIAISDNSETGIVKNFVEDLNSSQINYRYYNEGLSFVENFNRATELADGDYFYLIGDDDAILPQLIDLVEWAKANNVDTISPEQCIAYYWPGSSAKYPDGYVEFSKGSGIIKRVDSRLQLKKVIKNGMQLYTFFQLPKLYHGLVKKDIMYDIKNKTGHFYGGLSPDIYSCIAIASLSKNHYIIETSVSIAGVCAKSGSADQLKGAHSGELEGIPHLKYRGSYIWSDKIPAFYSINTIWAESAIKALEELGEYSLINDFNLYQLLAHSTANNYKFIPKILKREKRKVRKKEQILFLKYYFNMGIAYYSVILNKLKRELLRRTKKKHFDNVLSIQKAIDIYLKNDK